MALQRALRASQYQHSTSSQGLLVFDEDQCDDHVILTTGAVMIWIQMQTLTVKSATLSYPAIFSVFHFGMVAINVLLFLDL